MASQGQYDYAQAGQLTEKIHKLLTEKECSIFNRGLADYHKRKSIKTFVECLSLVLNTGYKRKLLIPIREAYVKPSDLAKFNQLVQAQGLATSYRQRQKAAEKTILNSKGDGLKKIDVKRDSDGEWGFSIRGGSEHGLGIFVSWIEPGSNAEKCGLQVGDQILKANDTSFTNINHYDAVTAIQNAKKLQIHILAHGRVPGSRMAHKVYHWVDPEGRPSSPPPDPFEIQDKAGGRDYKIISEADERKVTVVIDKGRDLGISIRGGIEHGLGIYISAAEEDSVAESHGLKIGDQILEVNGVSFLGIVHADAAYCLRAQACMVMKIKDVGKLPHSRITTYSNTKWYPSSQSHSRSQPTTKVSLQSPIFTPGVGSQVMLGQQQSSLFQGHGLLKDMAKSVLNGQELALFMYHINQYQQYDLPVDELLPPILHILDTPEKLQLLTELRGLMKPQDIERFNELTVHKEIMAKKYRSHSPVENGGRDTVPQKLSPDTPQKHFHTPPSSTPGNLHSGLQLAINGDDAVDGPWGKSELSPIHSPQSPHEGFDTSIIEARVRNETESRLRSEFEEKQKKLIEEQQRILEEERAKKEEALRLERKAMEEQIKQRQESLKAEVEESIRLETERELSAQLEEKERLLQEERERIHEEKRHKEEEFQLQQEQLQVELEEKIWKEADEKLREEYDLKRQQEREASLKRRTTVSEKAAAWDVEGRIRRDLENKIRREYEEKLSRELRKLKQHENIEREKMEEELQRKKHEEIARLEAEEQSRIELEEKIRREAELKVRAEFEARLQNEAKERVKLAEEVQARKSAEERLQKERLELQKERERQQKEFQNERQRERQEREKAMANIVKEKAELERKLQQQQQDQQRQMEEQRQRKQLEIVEERQQEEQQQRRVQRNREEQKTQEEQRKREKQKKQVQQRQQQQQKRNPEPFVESETSDEEDGVVAKEADEITAAQLQEQQQLEEQRRIRLIKEKEEERRHQQQLAEAENERKQQQLEQAKKKELERKREENVRKREENLRKKEEERRQKELERQENQQPSPSLSRNPNAILEKEKKRQEAERIAAVTSQQGKSISGVEDSSLKRKKAKRAKEMSIEEERRKAEERLQRRLKRSQEKKYANEANVIEEQIVPAGKSYGGFTDLHGNILRIKVTKVVKKLGIAIDGGANTKQKAVVVREISPEGCAAMTGMGMAVNQQILEVNGHSLFGLRHRDVVMVIKSAFDGPMNKNIDFVVLDSE